MAKIAALLLAITCLSCSQRNGIVVASKNFTEQILLGEIAAQQIERKTHLHVKRRLGLGGTLLSHEALIKGQIDVYPEYSGTAAVTVLKQPQANLDRIASEYERQFHVRWLPPLGFNDSFAMVVRSADANRLAAPTLSAARSRSWRLGVGYEFLTRKDGLDRLDSVYNLRWAGTPKTMDLGLLYAALADRQIDMAAANTTDALASGAVYAILTDDRHAFPAYEACYLVRDETLARFPAAGAALRMLSGTISENKMRAMNQAVDIQHRPVVEVAKEFLLATDAQQTRH